MRRLDPTDSKRVVQAVDRLATQKQGDVVRVKGVIREWRLRVGDYRVRFTYDSAANRMIILYVRKREEAYRR
ncbi:MAG: hypothetical protein AUJ92_04430 [Armatimonadetes bacterium CG2_30_59_28]|nr:type II toxin-antitoxin system RelE/ParE family toxin [Armatimonadota bacterium]OIO97043.1 MAG: hypothetical protein AUJ92_04430 [Armatimonadetes bacterium CG2_30_59_28]PIU67598.1 MAG: hypothetical protein COS85_00065 [Armatimonadetes bacterium CG07_land_8_20_14_0_80_59_28]PIX42040.1 MAG: hypothetical protein COZ56_10275 [Armatimonadetes bacterium CG_4_8_14_3_um_filter_58_9]PIY42767.1 MAG: hypothetical protein COZ05_13010 [Armatimonadetes bacterium CG_4_10_14_3_um_filter_59_10]PJB66728.1 MA